MCRRTSLPGSAGSSNSPFRADRSFSLRRFPGEQAASLQQFRVQNRRSGRASNRVVSEDDEPVVEYAVREQPPDGNAHAAAGVAVQAGLRAGFFVSHNDGMLGSGVQFQLLRYGPVGGGGFANFLDACMF